MIIARNEGHVQGELAEFAVAADLVKQGCRVSYTHGKYKYSLVADSEDDLHRMQVKKAIGTATSRGSTGCSLTGTRMAMSPFRQVCV
ncbi:group I intron-associated PD-(D/E)XK endonuclease [Halorhabdus tiamatea]|uniref:group I intron-associated PD-(D/E)XK endonuclease n=1 Tax=Halorhabdus tiamatea TaxID=430914 RepID=UPI00130DD992